jgi:hypothetical protein
MREAQEFSGHDLVEAVDTGYTVPEADDGADFVDRDLRFVVFDLLAD